MRRAIAALLLLTPLALHADVRLNTKGGNLEVLIDGDLFTEYRSDGRIPCLYPLIGPSGAALTRHYPFKKDVAGEASDHPHHVSFWFTHGAVNGHDFWHKDDCRIVHREFSRAETKSSSEGARLTHEAIFTVRLDWTAGGKTHLAEEQTYAIVAEGKTRRIGVTSRLTAADGDVLFGDTKEGSFAIRVAPTLRLKGKVAKGGILNSEGHTDDEAWGKRARWVAYHGPDGEGRPAVVAILDHPENLRHPTWWHARNYGLLAANPFGRHDFERQKEQPHLGDFALKNGKTLTQKYRLLLHEGTVESAGLDDEWKRFGGDR